MVFIGLDAGSVSVKLAVLDNSGNRLETFYQRHKGHPLRVAYELLERVTGNNSEIRTANSELFSLSVTGSAGKIIASVLGAGFTNELVAQAYATKKLYPQIRTIFELGGEDSKLIFLDEGGISDFSMNSVCAAGTGSFLDQQAERLRLTIEEFSKLALKSDRPSRIAGRCSVFAKSDMIHLQQIATPVEDIVAGLCFAVARNFRGSIVRGRPVREPVSFHGGVAANKGMVRAFNEIFDFREFFVPEEYALMGAIGAAMKGLDEGSASMHNLDALKAFIESSRFSDAGHKPLVLKGDDFFERHLKDSDELRVTSYELANKNHQKHSRFTLHASRIRAYLGIDIGSISTNLAVIDERGNLLAKRYLMTAGRPIDAVRQGLQEIGEEIGDYIEILGVGTTGSGRYMIADYVGADIVKNEITAQATAAAFIDPEVDTIFEIGGQDSKFISMRSGVIVDFEMNKACAAGTGSFLEEQAEKLDISIKDEFADCACSAESPCRLGERCTVFMENSLMANLQKGADKDDLLAGLAYSIVQNYINKVVAGKRIGENIFFQGGVAFNKSVVAAFEKYLNREIKVPPNHDVTGAIGMALIAMRHMKSQQSAVGGQQSAVSSQLRTPNTELRTTFKGFELSKRPYQVTSFECKACSNVCEINRVKIEGEDGFLFYGGRCEKYDVKKNRGGSGIPDLFKFREEMLWKEHLNYSSEFGVRSSELKKKSKIQNLKSKIGLPYIFFFHDYLPFWSTLLWELGFEVKVSPKTNREVVDTGAESVLADTCFPVKVAHGHIKYLIDKGTDLLFMPSFVSVNKTGDEYETGSTCPLTQTIPYAARVAHPSVKVLAPIIDFKRGMDYLIDELLKAFRPFGIKRDSLLRAISSAEKAQDDFTRAISDKGEEILAAIDKKTVVVIGRPYNAFDSGVNLGIPRKLADIGMLSMPLDFLPAGKILIRDRWPNMYWRSGQSILRAARFIRNHPHLYAIYIGNFS
ncbi:MAG: acyl-CoA dehydratase activase, partial [Nitrospirota bacterium]